MNPVLAHSPYPYYSRIEIGKENIINYSQFPLKALKIRYKISDPQKNWLQFGFEACDGLGFYADDIYFGANPSAGLDTTFQRLVQAGRKYRAYIIVSNKMAPYTYQDHEIIHMFFNVNNTDTTSVNFIVP